MKFLRRNSPAMMGAIYGVTLVQFGISPTSYQFWVLLALLVVMGVSVIFSVMDDL